MHTRLYFILLLALAPVALRPALAVATNRTIDDTNGDSVTGAKVFYQPGFSAGEWNSNPCSSCSIQPDLTQTFDGTWTAATYFLQTQDPINATMRFNGTAIYVFFILADTLHSGVPHSTAANFTLDNQPPVPFNHTAGDITDRILYNQLVFNQTNLQNTEHILVISASGPQKNVWVNFDYAIYTHEDLDIIPSNQPTETPGIQPTLSSTISGLPVTSQDQPTETPKTPPTLSPTPGIPVTSQYQSTETLEVQPTLSPTPGMPVTPHVKSTPVGAIVGGLVGGIAIIILLISGVFILTRRRRKMATWVYGRQAELEERLQVQRPMREAQDYSFTDNGGHNQVNTDDLQGVVRELRDQVTYLSQHRSAWEQRSTYVAPPVYSVTTSGATTYTDTE